MKVILKVVAYLNKYNSLIKESNPRQQERKAVRIEKVNNRKRKSNSRRSPGITKLFTDDN